MNTQAREALEAAREFICTADGGIGSITRIVAQIDAALSAPTEQVPAPTTLWIDCEFNEFRGELISLALVDEDGREFYQVLPCDNPGPWVAENVIPILGRDPLHGLREDAEKMLARALERFLAGYAAVHIVADWPEDIAHFCNALIIGPGLRVNTPPLTMEVRRDLDAVSDLPHNALADAKAVRAKALAASPSAPTAVQPADDALTHSERAACKQCGSDPHKMSCSVGGKTQLRLTANEARAALPATPVAPIDMVLHCPACGKQHIDAPEGQFIPGFTADESSYYNRWHGIWDNPPHRSHKCHGCGHIWRPADVPTNGVAAVKTKGKADSPIATPVAPKTLEALTEEQIARLLRAAIDLPTIYESAAFAKGVRAAERHRGIAAKNNMTLGGA